MVLSLVSVPFGRIAMIFPAESLRKDFAGARPRHARVPALQGARRARVPAHAINARPTAARPPA